MREHSKNYVNEMAERLVLKVGGTRDVEALRQTIEGNETFLSAMDTAALLPAEDPFYFMRFVRIWRESHGK